jgi:hypothetical protein
MAGRTSREIRDQDVQGLKCLRKIRPLLSRLHTHFEVLSGRAARIDATSASPKGDADERAVLQRTIEADRCSILDRGSIRYRLWNTIISAGSSSVCRSSDRTAATVMQVNELTEVDRAAGVIKDECVDLGWKSRHRIRPDHPVRLICVAVKPHAGCGNMRGPTCSPAITTAWRSRRRAA